MAASVRILSTGWSLVPAPLLLPRLSHTPTLCQQLRLHASPSAPRWSSRTEQPSHTRSREGEPGAGAGAGTRTEAEAGAAEEPEGPEYIPRGRKAKNPMIGIGYAWMVGLPAGVIGFVLAKRQVDKNRLKQLKVRQRMKNSNQGDYEGSRYQQHAAKAALDR